jgi:hypothetical protein
MIIGEVELYRSILKSWSKPLAKKLGRSAKKIAEEGLTTYDFKGGEVDIRFEDRSRVIFNDAFVLADGGFLAVFSEHCGYHVFPKSGAKKIIVTDWFGRISEMQVERATPGPKSRRVKK